MGWMICKRCVWSKKEYQRMTKCNATYEGVAGKEVYG
jgi:hypothetical protein